MMEYLPTNLLGEHLTEAPMQVTKVRVIMRDVLTGLQYLHSRHVVHRDVKMSNVLLTTEKRAKLCDFGMSVDLRNVPSDVRTGLGCGTLCYLPPELLEPNGTLTAKSDVWSSAVILFALAIGHLPYRGTVGPLELAIRSARYDIPDCLRRRLEMRAVIAVLQRMFVVDPAQRPTAEELLQDPMFLQ